MKQTNEPIKIKVSKHLFRSTFEIALQVKVAYKIITNKLLDLE